MEAKRLVALAALWLVYPGRYGSLPNRICTAAILVVETVTEGGTMYAYGVSYEAGIGIAKKSWGQCLQRCQKSLWKSKWNPRAVGSMTWISNERRRVRPASKEVSVGVV